MDKCNHQTPNHFDAHAPIGNNQYQCLKCGEVVTGFTEWFEIEQNAPNAAPDRRVEDMIRKAPRRSQMEHEFHRAVMDEYQSGYPVIY